MKLHKIRTITFIAAACFLSGLALSTPKTVRGNAETPANTSTFMMEEGAAARIKTLYDENNNPVESNGLRFSAEITQEEYDALQAQGARFGFVIVAKDLLGGVLINEDTVFGENPSFYFSNETAEGNGKIAMLNVAHPACQNIDADANVEICGSLVNIQTNNFTRSFVGRAYVAIPQADANGEIAGYTYYFAPYYENNVANNTRCIYYVAQRAAEDKTENASVLNEKYILPFSTTDRFTQYNYRYNVEHHYIVVENGQETIAHTQQEKLYAQLNSTVTAEPIEKPNVPALADKHFIFDSANAARTGLVYAAGMQTLHLYYKQNQNVSEESKDQTLDMILADFLDVNKAQQNFGVDTTEKGTWKANPVEESTGDNGDEKIVTGINLYTTSPSKNQKVMLAQEFFQKLNAYGVETITFSFYSMKNGKKPNDSYTMYKGNNNYQVVYTSTTTEDGIKRVTFNISELMENGVVAYGLRIDLGPDSSSKDGDYYFEDVQFGFSAR